VESLLKIPTVRIKNVTTTTEKLQKIIQDGRRNLHFISGNRTTRANNKKRRRLILSS
ncbi:hypothetical protein EDC96DRAFT_453179, partial [Choanephora cucurbitarum]